MTGFSGSPGSPGVSAGTDGTVTISQDVYEDDDSFRKHSKRRGPVYRLAVGPTNLAPSRRAGSPEISPFKAVSFVQPMLALTDRELPLHPP